MWHFAFKELQFKIVWDFIAKSFLSSILMVLFIVWFNPVSLFNVIVSIILGVIIYSILIFLFGGIGKKEINFFKKLIYEMVLSNK